MKLLLVLAPWLLIAQLAGSEDTGKTLAEIRLRVETPEVNRQEVGDLAYLWRLAQGTTPWAGRATAILAFYDRCKGSSDRTLPKLLSSFAVKQHGGDNFKIKAVLVKGADDQCADQSGTLTAWRKRFMKVFAMKKQNDDVQKFKVGTTPGADVVCIEPGPNGVTDTLVMGGDDTYDAAGTFVTAGPNGICETKANASGDFPNSYYPSDKGTKQDLLDALRFAYARGGNTEGYNHACYVDFEVEDVDTRLLFVKEIQAQTNTDWAAYLETQIHRKDKKHLENTYNLVGTQRLLDVLGTARQKPEVGISVGDIKAFLSQTDVNYNNIHELGHALVRTGEPIHDGHTDGATQVDCTFEITIDGGRGHEICEKHCKLVRSNVTRSWPNHDKTKIIADPEIARDSD